MSHISLPNHYGMSQLHGQTFQTKQESVSVNMVTAHTGMWMEKNNNLLTIHIWHPLLVAGDYRSSCSPAFLLIVVEQQTRQADVVQAWCKAS